MKRIFFVRHGQTQANFDDIAAGSELDSNLTQKGKEQAHTTGQELRNKSIDLIVSSSMGRTIETAKIIAEEIGYNPAKIVTTELFVERGMGKYSGGPNSAYMVDAEADNLHESAESTKDMHKRISKGLEWLKTFDAQNILLVSHGGVSRILRLIHQDLPLSHAYKLERIENAAIYEFDL